MMLKLCRTFVRLLESNKSLFGFSNFKIDQNSLSHDSVKCHSNMYETRNENSSEEGFFHISPKHVEANDDLKSANSHTKNGQEMGERLQENVPACTGQDQIRLK